MGRTLLTATLRVQQFERDWKIFSRAPRKVDREAFGELCAFAHFHAAAIAHSASPFTFEMILLTMLLGLVQRAEALERQGVMRLYDSPASGPAMVNSFQTNTEAIMLELRQRLAAQGNELYSFARALRVQDQKTLRMLLAITQTDPTRMLPITSPPSNERLLRSLVTSMRRIRQLEKQYMENHTLVPAEEWERACAIP